ncbi:MAG: enoyl-CoA hydratase/isomerase family protein [Rhodospirillales bacterium]|nr:enoyl-CoA hydratase/isomerase family protein [Rhodospirillales bacterium]
MTNELVRVERAERVATITLDNPPVNAIATRSLGELHRILDDIEKDKNVRCVILAGAGEKAFCAGADLREEAQFKDARAAKDFRLAGRRLLDRIEGLAKPVVAAIHGYCIGGGTALAWVCDIRLAADNAVFRAGDARLGLIPSWGMGLLRLPRFVGRNRALDILLLGDNFDAAAARELNLVTRVVPRAKLMDEARAIAGRIADASPQAILATRRAVAYGLRHGWDEMVTFEEELCEQVFAHPDAKEGPKAFLEKRPPKFQDL